MCYSIQVPVKFDCFLFSCFVMFLIFILGKMLSCLAFECSSTTGKFERKKSFHKIPDPKTEKARATQLSTIWGNAKINVDTFEAGKDKVCCSDHFHKDCFKRKFRSELKPYHSKKIKHRLG